MVQRKILTDIYTNLNTIYEKLAEGGTYWGHQYVRLLAYVEYDLTFLAEIEEDLKNEYDITPQKNLYIMTLERLIKDEINQKEDFPLELRKKMINELQSNIKNLNSLITDIFYLRKAQGFQYLHCSFL